MLYEPQQGVVLWMTSAPKADLEFQQQYEAVFSRVFLVSLMTYHPQLVPHKSPEILLLVLDDHKPKRGKMLSGQKLKLYRITKIFTSKIGP
jgi:hypothetical protein